MAQRCGLLNFVRSPPPPPPPEICKPSFALEWETTVCPPPRDLEPGTAPNMPPPPPVPAEKAAAVVVVAVVVAVVVEKLCPTAPISLPDIPPELLLLVAEFLTAPRDLLSLVLTCRHLNTFITPTLHTLALRTHSLGWAARKGFEPLVRLLLDKGIAVDSRPNTYSKTALHHASGEGHTPIVQLLLDRGASINIQGASGQTALHFAALNGRESAVRVLLAHGANAAIRNTAGLTPLLLAVRYVGGGDGETLFEMLLDAGAHVDAQERYSGWTALHWAVLKGREETVKLLLRKGASIRVVTTARGVKETPVHWALKKGDEEMVVLLLEMGSKEGQRRIVERENALREVVG